MVDEFQDTNRAQLELVRLLAGCHGNVCVVGDDDQSIYGWRGAEVSNLLDFERHFPGPAVVKLEQNYRSTTPILETANGVIRHNRGRRPKRLWSGREGGDKVRLIGMPGDEEEAGLVAGEVWEAQRSGGRPWEDFAVLFRMNSQSRPLEEALRKLSVPYRVIGGQSFFERREVKDVLAYLSVVVNPDDDVNLLRVINNPPRGISETTVAAATEHSIEAKTSIFAALMDDEFLALLGTRAREAVRAFTGMVELYGEVAAQPQASPGEIAGRLVRETGYLESLKRGCKSPEEAAAREQNVRELVESVSRYSQSGAGGLAGFLEKVALDDLRRDDGDGEERGAGVSLITLHAAKGLEFPVVYLVGLEEGLLPHRRALEEGAGDEERRLLYVGITRAMERLTLSYCHTRRRYGEPVPCQPSSFIAHLDPEHVERLSFGELANRPASGEVAKGYFGMMKERLAAIGDPPPVTDPG
jgi:superfamily I DNA/RNA helicase